MLFQDPVSPKEHLDAAMAEGLCSHVSGASRVGQAIVVDSSVVAV